MFFGLSSPLLPELLHAKRPEHRSQRRAESMFCSSHLTLHTAKLCQYLQDRRWCHQKHRQKVHAAHSATAKTEVPRGCLACHPPCCAGAGTRSLSLSFLTGPLHTKDLLMLAKKQMLVSTSRATALTQR